jgi:hypothetical protein
MSEPLARPGSPIDDQPEMAARQRSDDILLDAPPTVLVTALLYRPAPGAGAGPHVADRGV